MTRARLLTAPEDLARLGLRPGETEPWEVGRRQEVAEGRSELWHVEAGTDDGTAVAVAFCLVGPAGEGRAATLVNLFLTTPDGRRHQRAVPGVVDVADVGTTRCELPFGPHRTSGDLRRLDVEVAPDDGPGLHLLCEALVRPYRPGGTGHVALGGDGEHHFAVQAVARCRVSGTVTVDGRTWDVAGQGYSDHPWTDVDLVGSWRHWLWGRFHGERLTAMVFDLVTSDRYGLTRVPLLGVMDSTGAVVVDHRGAVESTVETERDPESGGERPARARHVARDGGRVVELVVERGHPLVELDAHAATEPGGEQRARYDELGVRPSYGRYRARGALTLTDASGTTTEQGQVVYELNDVGWPESEGRVPRPWPRHPREAS
ncbi:hypothetical protein [uncultured Pseudokineococcus sp.]|uniref:hypothetical protein n=1 Tax=uncultured Pseudokineococcus sp. TaxID=1642928 RepID=UPI00262C9AC7|nr:hypothetical protein [uncultured Pseudokineococcus sp.]